MQKHLKDGEGWNQALASALMEEELGWNSNEKDKDFIWYSSKRLQLWLLHVIINTEGKKN